ncbi:hypothetical protein LINGRAPRIM_LOCUS1565 [Linum grandiflorum]
MVGLKSCGNPRPTMRILLLLLLLQVLNSLSDKYSSSRY